MNELPYRVIGDSVYVNDWLALRNKSIGASEIGTVLGLTKNKSALQLFWEKRGEVEPEDLSSDDLVQCGNDLEPVIRDVIYPRKSGRKARPCGLLLQSVEYPWATCTLDGWTWEKDGEEWPLEVKNVHQFSEQEWEDGAPPHRYAQCQHQMLVTGKPRDTICALIGGCKPIWQDIERDEPFIRRIITAGEDFMRRIQDNDQPAPDDTEACARGLGLRWPKHKDGVSIELPEDCVEIARGWEALRTTIKDQETKLRAWKNKVKAHMGEAETGFVLGEGTFTWKANSRGARSLRFYPPKL